MSPSAGSIRVFGPPLWRTLCPKPQYYQRAAAPSRTSNNVPSISQISTIRPSRPFHTSPSHLKSPGPSKSHDRGPTSTEDTQTDFSKLNVLNNTPAPSSAIDACLHDGFHLSNGTKVTGGGGLLIVSGEAFTWKPWEAGQRKLLNAKGQWGCAEEGWGILDLVWPKPGIFAFRLIVSKFNVSDIVQNF